MTTIYLDMDGVVADFNTYAKNILNTEQMYHSWPAEAWQKIASNPRLYRDLDKTLEADELVQFCKNICNKKNWELKFLTAVPKNDDMPWAYYDKVNWINERYPGIPVFFGPYSHSKWNHCQPDDILIDDRVSNYEEWSNAGGRAILHKGDLAETLQQLILFL
jgi:5'(3')-deoxyribonucleotidase